MKVTVGKTGAYERPKDTQKVLTSALLEEAAAKAPAGFQHIVHATAFDHVSEILDPKTNLKTFHAKGKGTIQKLDVKADRLYPKKDCLFEMTAKESRDEIGLPDIEVTSLKLTEKG